MRPTIPQPRRPPPTGRNGPPGARHDPIEHRRPVIRADRAPIRRSRTPIVRELRGSDDGAPACPLTCRQKPARAVAPPVGSRSHRNGRDHGVAHSGAGHGACSALLA